ncbi:MAG: glycosyltransferase [Desulfococcaceae bacterium]
MKVLLAVGQHQYGDPARGLSTEYAAFFPALERLGHEVAHFELWNRRIYPGGFAELNRRLLARVREDRPDVLLTVQLQYEIWIETLLAIRALGHAAAVCWTTDDSWKFREVSRFIGPAYDAMTTTYPSVLPRYHAHGIRNVLPTQWAAPSDALCSPRPAAECRYPVSFVGTANPDRKSRIAALKKAGIPVACFGHGWPAGPVPFESISGIIRDSAISLNFSTARGGRQLKARTFEVPGAGGFLLTEDAPGLERWYRPGEEVAVFRNSLELAGRIRHFLDRPAERDAVARAGHQRTRREHTYEHRLEEVLRFARRAAGNRPSHPRPEEIQLTAALGRHRLTTALRLLRRALIRAGTAAFGPERGPRAARRLVFEISWRLAGSRTFSAGGWPGRMFWE